MQRVYQDKSISQKENSLMNDFIQAKERMVKMDGRPEVERAGEIQKVLETQETTIGCLGDVVSTLANRLTPVIVDETPPPTGEAKSPPLTKLAAIISQHTERIRAISDRLTSILDRLEL